MVNITDHILLVDALCNQSDLTTEIARLEHAIQQKCLSEFTDIKDNPFLNGQAFAASMPIKKIAGQINVLIHASGILTALPKILEPDERVVSVSLGAGNTGKDFDLETSHRVAEFKFINWRGGPESIRENSIFKDFYRLAEYEGKCRRCLYVINPDIPLRFFQNRRALNSVLKTKSFNDEFYQKYGERYRVVSEYYHDKKHLVEIIDLAPLLPDVTAFDCEDS